MKDLSGANCSDKAYKLTKRQQLFCDNYLQSGNLAESAIKAGYSKNYANAQGYKLLEKVGIKKYIESREKKIDSSNIASETQIKEFWTSLMFDKGEETKDRIKASELLGKTKGLFIDRQEIKLTPSSLADELRKLTPEQLEEVIKNV